jgi:hypothetical protein
MEIIIKHYGNSRITPSKIIELTCISYDTQFTADVTNLKGLVDVRLIENLRHVADELEEQNRLVNEKNNNDEQL